MIRLHVTTEGLTELAFVKSVLAPHLAMFQVYAYPRSVLTSRDNRTEYEYRGGTPSYQRMRNDIERWMRENHTVNCWFTTMFDLYALGNDFPGYIEATTLDPYIRVGRIEAALSNDINHPRFIPYIQLHEFESLILADPRKLDWEFLEHDRQIDNIVQMVGDKNPELINDGAETAPSKRIIQEIPEYHKPTAGVAVIEKIGIQGLKERCRHFGDWVTCLEDLGEKP